MIDCKKFHHLCHAGCCGVVPIDKHLFDSLKHRANPKTKIVSYHDLDGHLIPVTEDFKCCFLQDDLSCGIYEERPEVCRKFGDESHPLMSCPVADKDGRLRTRQGKRQLQRTLDNYMPPVAPRTHHLPQDAPESSRRVRIAESGSDATEGK